MAKTSDKPKVWKIRTIKHAPRTGTSRIDPELAQRTLEEIMRKREQPRRKTTVKRKTAKRKMKFPTIVQTPYRGQIDTKLADKTLREVIREREQRERKTTAK